MDTLNLQGSILDGMEEIVKADVTPRKSDVLNAGSKIGGGSFEPGKTFQLKAWMHEYLYSKISWIYRCANKIADTAVSLGVSPKRVASEMGEGIEDFLEFLEIFFQDANTEDTFLSIYGQLHKDLSINGKAYLVFEFLEREPPFTIPIAMYRVDFRTIRPVRMDEYLNHFNTTDNCRYRNNIVFYVQEIIDNFQSLLEPLGKKADDIPTMFNAPWIFGNGANVRYFYPEQVIEFKLDSFGVSPLDTLEYSMGTEIAAQIYTYSYFKNATKTGMILSMEAGSVGDAKRNKEALKESYINADTAWETMLLVGGIKLVRDSANTSDVKYLEIREFNKEECCAAMGVPPSLIGDMKAKASDKEEDKLAFEEETVRPRSLLILNKLAKYLYNIFKEYKRKFELVPGIRGRSSLHLMKIAQMQLMCGGTPNESRELVGLPLVRKEDVADEIFSAANLVPISYLKQMMEQKQAGPNSLRDNNAGGQPRNENVQGDRSGKVNEQR